MPKNRPPRRRMSDTRKPSTRIGWKAGAVCAAVLVAVVGGSVATSLYAGSPASATDVMADGPLPDNFVGRPRAPVAVVEYASMTCSHCAAFSRDVFPEFERTVIAKGMARFAVREFPLDPLAMAAAMLGRCVDGDRQMDVTKALFARQSEWMSAPDRTGVLKGIVAPYGLDGDGFEACLADAELQENVRAMRARGGDLGVAATPTFFVDGVRYEGPVTAAGLRDAVEKAAADRSRREEAPAEPL